MVLTLVVAALASVSVEGTSLLVKRASCTHQVDAGLASGNAIEAGLDALGHHLFAGMLANAQYAGSVAVVAIVDAVGDILVDSFKVLHRDTGV